jgi:hypothetical protein
MYFFSIRITSSESGFFAESIHDIRESMGGFPYACIAKRSLGADELRRLSPKLLNLSLKFRIASV